MLNSVVKYAMFRKTYTTNCVKNLLIVILEFIDDLLNEYQKNITQNIDQLQEFNYFNNKQQDYEF